MKTRKPWIQGFITILYTAILTTKGLADLRGRQANYSWAT